MRSSSGRGQRPSSVVQGREARHRKERGYRSSRPLKFDREDNKARYADCRGGYLPDRAPVSASSYPT